MLSKGFSRALVLGLAALAPPAAAAELTNYTAGLPATDALGRALPTHAEVGDLKPGKTVGLFYWTWHLHLADHPPHDVSKILTKAPDAINDYNHPAWPPLNDTSYFYWGEPLFGYYRNTDRWVLYRHAEMLADAGVDVIFFDCTNAHLTWRESYMALCEVFTEARRAGIRTPQIASMMPFGPSEGSLRGMKDLYADLYKPGLYKDLWFQWKGKPFIMGYPENLVDVPGDDAASALHREIRNFFTFRPGQPVYDKGPQRPDHWGWLEVTPQHGFFETGPGEFEQATVGVSQNWSKERGLTAMNASGTFGRSYTHARGHITTSGAVNHGFNFQEQWEHALKIDPEFIFITGWNEWVAGRQPEWGGQKNAFPDQYSQECSRDIEPMKGGHGDNYYYQMVSNIRRFKGMPAPQPTSGPVIIKIDGRLDDWTGVQPDYQAHKGNTLHRDHPGWKGTHYTNTTGRNDITRARAAGDAEALYFAVETSDTLTSPTDRAWMRLLIDADRDKSTGWEGYDYLVHRHAANGEAAIEKSDSGWNWQPAGTATWAANGHALEVRVPRSAFATTGTLNLEFKWSDNMQTDGDIMDFLLNGDVAPAGRFNYQFSEK